MLTLLVPFYLADTEFLMNNTSVVFNSHLHSVPDSITWPFSVIVPWSWDSRSTRGLVLCSIDQLMARQRELLEYLRRNIFHASYLGPSGFGDGELRYLNRRPVAPSVYVSRTKRKPHPGSLLPFVFSHSHKEGGMGLTCLKWIID